MKSTLTIPPTVLTPGARVFHDVDAELDGVARADLLRAALLRRLRQPLVVDECAVATFRVLQVELLNEGYKLRE